MATDKEAKKLERKASYEREIHNHWHTRREKGKWHFIWRFGVFTWGVTTFCFYWIFLWILIKLTGVSIPMYVATFIQAIFYLSIFMIFGIFYGLYLWNKNEKIYLDKYPYGKRK